MHRLFLHWINRKISHAGLFYGSDEIADWVSVTSGNFCYNMLFLLPLSKYWFIASRHFAYLPTGEKKNKKKQKSREILLQKQMH